MGGGSGGAFLCGILGWVALLDDGSKLVAENEDGESFYFTNFVCTGLHKVEPTSQVSVAILVESLLAAFFAGKHLHIDALKGLVRLLIMDLKLSEGL